MLLASTSNVVLETWVLVSGAWVARSLCRHYHDFNFCGDSGIHFPTHVTGGGMEAGTCSWTLRLHTPSIGEDILRAGFICSSGIIVFQNKSGLRPIRTYSGAVTIIVRSHHAMIGDDLLSALVYLECNHHIWFAWVASFWYSTTETEQKLTKWLLILN